MRQKALRSFPNRYLFSLYHKVTSSLSIRYILRIILLGKRCPFEVQKMPFYKPLCNPLYLNRLQRQFSTISVRFADMSLSHFVRLLSILHKFLLCEHRNLQILDHYIGIFLLFNKKFVCLYNFYYLCTRIRDYSTVSSVRWTVYF